MVCIAVFLSAVVASRHENELNELVSKGALHQNGRSVGAYAVTQSVFQELPPEIEDMGSTKRRMKLRETAGAAGGSSKSEHATEWHEERHCEVHQLRSLQFSMFQCDGPGGPDLWGNNPRSTFLVGQAKFFYLLSATSASVNMWILTRSRSDSALRKSLG